MLLLTYAARSDEPNIPTFYLPTLVHLNLNLNLHATSHPIPPTRYTLLLEPWIHYVPVDYHFRRLHEAAAWVGCNRTLPLQRTMLSNMRAYTDAVLTRRAALRYASALLEGYAAAQKYRAAGARATCSEPALSYLERTRPYGEYFHGT